ncbi:MAG: hypothetical protein ACRCXN_12900 [Bacteroidales bacterium]
METLEVRNETFEYTDNGVHYTLPQNKGFQFGKTLKQILDKANKPSGVVNVDISNMSLVELCEKYTAEFVFAATIQHTRPIEHAAKSLLETAQPDGANGIEEKEEQASEDVAQEGTEVVSSEVKPAKKIKPRE